MRRLFLIGHRGVGKSTVLASIRDQLPGLKCLDLDAEIEAREARTIAEIFRDEGESRFREIEKRVLNDLLQPSKEAIIALGAGFEGSDHPIFDDDATEVLWLRRESDRLGRIFLNRPRLDRSVSPLEEFLARVPQREARYRQVATSLLTLPEGGFFNPSWECESILARWMGRPSFARSGILALTSEILARRGGIKNQLEAFRTGGIARFELRDDLLSEPEVREILPLLSPGEALFSFRGCWAKPEFNPACERDWALELGSPGFQTEVVSLHERLPGESVGDSLGRLAGSVPGRTHLKAALEIQTFEELEVGHRWWLADPEHRSFLPRGGGRWRWYRLWMKDRQKLSFVCEWPGEVPDQPTGSQWSRTLSCPTRFGAVLGDPVAFSHSPAIQREFFSKKKMPFFAVPVAESEWSTALPVLERLGLCAAAVTAPLKKKAFEWVGSHAVGVASQLESVNTLLKRADHWVGANTDQVGFQRAVEEWAEEPGHVALWGGGGTLAMMKAVFPQAIEYSARDGRSRSGEESVAPETLVWAVGATRRNEITWPQESWSPRWVLDLNYHEDSPGREYALRCGARYYSGEVMFRHQAQAQQEFWSDL